IHSAPFGSVGEVKVGASVTVGDEVSVGLTTPPGDGESVGDAAVPSSAKPLARTASPTTMSATMTRTRPVLRFTRAILPSEPRPGSRGAGAGPRGPAPA